jgi:hypothetical protein
MCNALHFYLNADGTVRDLSSVDSDSWPLPDGQSNQGVGLLLDLT